MSLNGSYTLMSTRNVLGASIGQSRTKQTVFSLPSMLLARHYAVHATEGSLAYHHQRCTRCQIWRCRSIREVTSTFPLVYPLLSVLLFSHSSLRFDYHGLVARDPRQAHKAAPPSTPPPEHHDFDLLMVCPSRPSFVIISSIHL